VVNQVGGLFGEALRIAVFSLQGKLHGFLPKFLGNAFAARFE